MGDWKLMVGTFGYVSCDRTYMYYYLPTYLPAACLLIVLTRAHRGTGRALWAILTQRQLEDVNATLDSVLIRQTVPV